MASNNLLVNEGWQKAMLAKSEGVKALLPDRTV